VAVGGSMESILYCTDCGTKEQNRIQLYIDLETSCKVKHAYLKSNVIYAIYRGRFDY
jgi:hypothetical protein